MYTDKNWGYPFYLIFFFMSLVTCCVNYSLWHPPHAQTPASSWTRVKSEEESTELPGLERTQRRKDRLCRINNTSLLRKATDHHHIHHIQTWGFFQTEVFSKFVKAALVFTKHQDSQTTGNISCLEAKFFHPGTSVCLCLWVCYVMCVLVCYLNHNSTSSVLPG